MAASRMQNKQVRGAAWMRHLAYQYKAVREQYPGDRLMIVFDIDGTILDMRYMMVSVLKDYDRVHATSLFSALSPRDIFVHENNIETLLDHVGIVDGHRQDIITWYGRNYWSPESIAGSQRPFNGVFDVIRWFQIQPNTHVSLNTGRGESLRSGTLQSLNTLGEEYRVRFSNDLLYMNKGVALTEGKVAGIRHFESMGYRVFAVVDNEPANLKAIAEQLTGRDILLLHADTIFESPAAYIPEGAETGDCYDLTELIPHRILPHHIQFVWHGVNNEQVLRQFLISNVHWAELHVRFDLGIDRIILRRRSFEDVPLTADEHTVLLEDVLSILKVTDRGVKLDVLDFGLVERILPILREFGFKDHQIWINGTVEKLHRRGMQAIIDEFPGSIRQCPVDFMGFLILTAPHVARKRLNMFSRWGISRFSISWQTPNCRKIINRLQAWGYEVNIYNVPDLEAFLQSALIMPESITSYFNFPKWFMDGNDEEREIDGHLQRMTA